MDSKICKICGQKKDISEFRIKYPKSERRHSYCKLCYKEYRKEWRKNNKDKVDLCNKRCKLKVYGLTPEGYDKMYHNQKGRCLICGKHQSELNENLCVDHDHQIKGVEAVRGLLCKSCNSGIGLLQDSAELCSAAADYLRMYEGRQKKDR